MRYNFELDIYTDGVFKLDYIPVGMKVGLENCRLEKVFNDKESALKYIKETTEFLKNNIQGHDYDVFKFNKMIDNFNRLLENNTDNKLFACKYMSDYEDDTFIQITTTANRYDISLTFLTDEEYKYITETKMLSYDDIRDAILTKCKEVREKYDGK